MRDLAAALAILLGAANLIAGAYGGWRWYTVAPDRLGWRLLRGAQAVTGLVALVGAGLYLGGFEPGGGGLFWLYLLLGVPVSFFAEQLRLASAQTVLDARGLEDAKAMERLDDAAQRSVVLAILRRELGVIAVAALVIAFLALRAYNEL